MHFFQINTENGMLGLILSEKIDPVLLHYKIINVHRSRKNLYNKDIVGFYLMFINGHSMYNKNKSQINFLKLKKTPCTFAISNDVKEIKKIVHQLEKSISSQSVSD